MQLVTRQPAFPMRAIRAMVCFLPVAQNRQHPLRIVRRARDDRGHQKLCLRQRQCRSVFLNRPCSRTKKPSAKSTSVI